MGVPAWRGQLLQGTPPPAPPHPRRHQHRGWGPCSPQGTVFFVVPERPRDWGRETAPSPDGVCSAFSPAALELGAWQGWGQGLQGCTATQGPCQQPPDGARGADRDRSHCGASCAGVRYGVVCGTPKRCEYTVQLAKAIIYLACLCHKKTTMDSGQRFGSHLHLLI